MKPRLRSLLAHTDVAPDGHAVIRADLVADAVVATELHIVYLTEKVTELCWALSVASGRPYAVICIEHGLPVPHDATCAHDAITGGGER